MAINIQMNLKNSSGTYDVLYPETIGSQVSGQVASAKQAYSATTANTATTATTASDLSSTLTIAKGGTSSTSASSAVYNLLQGLSTRTAAQVNSYASSTYLGAYYSSTGYKIAISNLLTYFQNNISSNSGLVLAYGTRTGTGNLSYSISTSSNINNILIFATGKSGNVDVYNYHSTAVNGNLIPTGSLPGSLLFHMVSNYTGQLYYAGTMVNKNLPALINLSYSDYTILINSSYGAEATYIANQSGTNYYWWCMGY